MLQEFYAVGAEPLSYGKPAVASLTLNPSQLLAIHATAEGDASHGRPAGLFSFHAVYPELLRDSSR